MIRPLALQHGAIADPAVRLPDVVALARERPDESWMAVDECDRIVAAASLWWAQTPLLAGRKAGAIGHFSAADGPAAAELLGHACARLKHAGCATAVAPLDGSTWRSYRAVTEPGDRAPFALELTTPPEWPDFFRASGFASVAQYRSAMSELRRTTDAQLAARRRHFDRIGLAIRSFDRSRSDQELRALHGLSLAAFRKNFLYTPVALACFLDLYRPLVPMIKPELFLMAEHDRRLVGFVFAIPDFNHDRRNGPADTIVVKTIAAAPGRSYMGLGRALLDELVRRALAMGFRFAVHAMMHVSNASSALSLRSAFTIRRYALFARTLA